MKIFVATPAWSADSENQWSALGWGFVLKCNVRLLEAKTSHSVVPNRFLHLALPPVAIPDRDWHQQARPSRRYPGRRKERPSSGGREMGGGGREHTMIAFHRSMNPAAISLPQICSCCRVNMLQTLLCWWWCQRSFFCCCCGCWFRGDGVVVVLTESRLEVNTIMFLLMNSDRGLWWDVALLQAVDKNCHISACGSG